MNWRIVVGAALCVIVLTGCGLSVESKVHNAFGVDASNCRLTGRMLVGGRSEKVFRCDVGNGNGGTIGGCYAISGDEVSDVSKTFQTLIQLQGKTVDCGEQ